MMFWPAETQMFIPSDHGQDGTAHHINVTTSQVWIMVSHCNPSVSVSSLFPCEPLFVQSTISSTNFSISAASSSDNFISLVETQYNPEMSSLTTLKPNPAQLRLLKSKLAYREKVRMKNEKSNAVASFSTSFKFSVTQEEQLPTSGVAGYRLSPD